MPSCPSHGERKARDPDIRSTWRADARAGARLCVGGVRHRPGAVPLCRAVPDQPAFPRASGGGPVDRRRAVLLADLSSANRLWPDPAVRAAALLMAREGFKRWLTRN